MVAVMVVLGLMVRVRGGILAQGVLIPARTQVLAEVEVVVLIGAAVVVLQEVAAAALGCLVRVLMVRQEQKQLPGMAMAAGVALAEPMGAMLHTP